MQLIGLDFGSTTSSALIAEAPISKNCVTGRMELGVPKTLFQSEPVFTPYTDQSICESSVQALLDEWLQPLMPEIETAGGAILTGLAAQSNNVKQIKKLIRAKLGNTLIATAEDPHFESWLAFKGSVDRLSRSYPTQTFLNIDIGGGTTNIAVGTNGNVIHTDYLFVGARHFQVVPGTYQLKNVTRWGLEILPQPKTELSKNDLDKIMNQYLDSIRRAIQGYSGVLCYSGGVGELIYAKALRNEENSRTCFGDLGIDLANAIVHSDLKPNLDFVPSQLGRATVHGITLSSTELSGSTFFQQCALPLQDLPILGSLSVENAAAQIERISHMKKGTALQVSQDCHDLSSLRHLGSQLAQAFTRFPISAPLVLLVPHNLGHALGNYATDWGKLSVPLLTLDEVSEKDANFVNVGKRHKNVIPITYYGYRAQRH